jgi:signal transduction histidine kinase/integral membrane sensor domain MASE1/CheY-like chemotaxis protein
MAPAWGSEGWYRWAGLTDMLEPIVAWSLYRYVFGGSLFLNGLQNAVAFLLSAPILGCATSAIVGTITLALLGQIPVENLATAIPHWWVGNAIGTMAIVPVALLWLTPILQQYGWLPETNLLFRYKNNPVSEVLPLRPAPFPTPFPWAEIGMLLILSIGTSWAAVVQSQQADYSFQLFSLLSFVPVLWSAIRFGVAGGMLMTSLCVMLTLVGYLLVYPHAISLPQFPVPSGVLYVHKFSLVVQCMVSLCVGTAITEMTAAQVALAVERVRSSESQARAQLAEQLVQLNQSLTEANRELQHSEERFRTSVENMLDCFGIYTALRDEPGRITGFCTEYINTAACQKSPLFKAETDSEEYCDRLAIHQDSDLFQAFCLVVETGQPLVRDSLIYEELDGEHRLSQAFDIRISKFGDGFVATWRDITERKQIEVERAELLSREQEARKQAEAASRTKDEFLAIVSHELRSPLSAILGWSRLLVTRQMDETTTRRALEAIERNAQAQTQLIEDLLDISRIIRGKVRLYTRPVSLVQVVEAAIDTVRPTADTKSIQMRLETHHSSAPFLVLGDPDRLQQVVWNLLLNGIKFTPNEGQVTVHLSVEENSTASSNSVKSTAYAQIQVIDTGKGISAEFLPQVFDRFRQAESATTRVHGGLGLGLAIVRSLVDLHGGIVEAASEGEGKGATFTVRLPLLQKQGSPSDHANSSDSATPSFTELSGLNVVIVDDEPDIRDLLATVLEQYGVQVTLASSAREVMALLPQMQPDLLISDIGMPVEDGYDLIHQIRQLPAAQGGQVPAIALTAFAREEDRVRALNAGFQMHLSKPIDPARLVLVVAGLMSRFR